MKLKRVSFFLNICYNYFGDSMKQKNNVTDEEFNIKALAIIMLIVLVLILGTFLFTENFVVNKTNTSENSSLTKRSSISVGKTFQMPDKVYYVLYLDMSKYVNESIYKDIILKYETNPVYVVDLSLDLNKHVLSDTINEAPTSIDNLKVTDETLIRIEDGRVTKYIEQLKNITSELK